MRMNVLWVDDEPSARRIGKRFLSAIPDVEVLEAGSKSEALAALAANPIDIAFVDVRLSRDPRNRDGQLIVKHVRESTAALPVVVTSLSEVGEIKTALRNGAYDYILKESLTAEAIAAIVDRFRSGVAAREYGRTPAPARRDREAEERFAGTSAAAERVRGLARRFAATDRPVLVTGATGTGKEVVARMLHRLSDRADQPMIPLNCGALPANLVESQLFGHRRGAFTGAFEDKEGHFQAVGRGTLFLDEIGELPLELQPKLLRVLEARTFLPIGSSVERRFEGRIVAATHVDLEALVAQRRFREDLLYRLDVLRIDIPCLKERREDIPLIAAALLASQGSPIVLADDALAALAEAEWPGNVRQLRNCLDLLSVLRDETTITAAMVREALGPGTRTRKTDSVTLASAIRGFVADDFDGDKLRFLESAAVSSALEKADGNKSAAAKLLGVHRKVVQRRIDEGLDGSVH